MKKHKVGNFDLFEALIPLMKDLENRKSDADCEQHFIDNEQAYEDIAKNVAKEDDKIVRKRKRKKK